MENHHLGLVKKKVALVENPPFLTKSFQLHDICNYVSTWFFKLLIMAIAN
jgi:hypothetical protein